MVTWTKEDEAAFQNRRKATRAQPQSPVRDEPAPAHAGEGTHSARFLVSVVSVRKRLCDPDNLCAKYFIDCLRYAGVIPDDTPEVVQVFVTQRKAIKGEPEHTLVTVDGL